MWITSHVPRGMCRVCDGKHARTRVSLFFPYFIRLYYYLWSVYIWANASISRARGTRQSQKFDMSKRSRDEGKRKEKKRQTICNDHFFQLCVTMEFHSVIRFNVSLSLVAPFSSHHHTTHLGKCGEWNWFERVFLLLKRGGNDFGELSIFLFQLFYCFCRREVIALSLSLSVVHGNEKFLCNIKFKKRVELFFFFHDIWYSTWNAVSWNRSNLDATLVHTKSDIPSTRVDSMSLLTVIPTRDFFNFKV